MSYRERIQGAAGRARTWSAWMISIDTTCPLDASPLAPGRRGCACVLGPPKSGSSSQRAAGPLVRTRLTKTCRAYPIKRLPPAWAIDL